MRTGLELVVIKPVERGFILIGAEKDLPDKKDGKGGKKKARWQGFSFFLTYSQAHEDLTKEGLLEELKGLKKLEISQYVIGQEKHEDGGIHFHVYLKVKKRVDTIDCRFFDVNFKKKVEHPSIGTVKAKNSVIAYCIKDQDFIANFPIYHQDGKLTNAECHYTNMALTEGIAKTLRVLSRDEPALYNRRLLTWQKLFKEARYNQAEMLRAENPPAKLKLSQLKVPKEIQDWIDGGCTCSAIFLGGPGTGKTVLAEAICHHVTKLRNKTYVVITDVNGLDQLQDPSVGGFVFDDPNFNEVDERKRLHILDTGSERRIKIIYTMVTIQPRLVQIFSINEISQIASIENWDQPLARRLKLFVINESVLIESEETRAHSKHYNNPETIASNLAILRIFTGNKHLHFDEKGRMVTFPKKSVDAISLPQIEESPAPISYYEEMPQGEQEKCQYENFSS